MVLPIRPTHTTPIPNNPFYSPNGEYLDAASGPLVVGDGLEVDYATGEIQVIVSATPVTSINAGNGIQVTNGGGGAYTVCNTGVLEVFPGYGINITNLGNQRFEIATVLSQGTVTSVTAGPGLTGGVITTSGTIALRNIDPPVTGCYTWPQSITVDNFGRVNCVTAGVQPIPISIFNAKGTLPVGIAPGQAVALPIGVNGHVLTADSSCATGMRWGPVDETAVTCIQGIDPIYVTGTQFVPFINISPATLTTCGAVRLSNSTNSSSIDDALTAAAGCNLQQQINALVPYDGTVSVVTATSPISITSDPSKTPNVQIDAATTSNPGAVQLNDTTASTSVTEALTANQGRNLQQQINSLATSLGANLAGTIDASTGLLVTVTPAGTSKGFVSGSTLPAANASRSTYYVVVEVAGTMTPPGGVPTLCGNGDWWFCDGASWIYLKVGYVPPSASTTTPGIVELATDTETQLGADATRAVTPASLQSKLCDSCNYASSTTIASSKALACVYNIALAGCAYATTLTAGNVCLATDTEVVNGTSIIKAITPSGLQAKVSDSTTLPSSCFIASSLALATTNAVAVGAVQNSLVTNKGQILVGCASGCVRNLPNAPADGCALVSCSSSLYGVCWGNPGGPTLIGVTCSVSPYTTALGSEAITTGNSSTAIGYRAGYGLNTNAYNVLVGHNAGQLGGGTTCFSTYVGYAAGQADGGCFNTAIGYGSPSGGDYSTNVGAWAGGLGGGGGAGVVSVGYLAGGQGQPGCYNVLIGTESAYQIPSTATSNVVIGRRAAGGGSLQNIPWNGAQAVAIGAGSNYCASLAYQTVSIGHCSLLCGGCYTVAIGTCSGFMDSFGTANGGEVFIGYRAGQCSGGEGNVMIGKDTGFQSECRNVYIGDSAGYCAHGNWNSVAVGYCSMWYATAGGGQNTAIGGFALCNPTVDIYFMTAVGWGAGRGVQASQYGVYIGTCAGSDSSGDCSVYVGHDSGGGALGACNTAIGSRAALLACGDGYNTYIGAGAGYCSCGYRNVVVGYNSFSKVDPSRTPLGCCNVIIGSLSGNLTPYTLNNVVWVGDSINFANPLYVNGAVVIGNPSSTGYYMWATGWCTLSDARSKTCITDSALGLSFINKIQPREFTWNHQEEDNPNNGKRAIGVIAQEVAAAVASEESAENLGAVAGNEESSYFVTPTQFTWPLINAVKELSAENTDLKARLCSLESRLSALESNG